MVKFNRYNDIEAQQHHIKFKMQTYADMLECLAGQRLKEAYIFVPKRLRLGMGTFPL